MEDHGVEVRRKYVVPEVVCAFPVGGRWAVPSGFSLTYLWLARNKEMDP